MLVLLDFVNCIPITMADNRQMCVLCNRSVINRRRYEITHARFEDNPAVAQYIIEAVTPERQVSQTKSLCLICHVRNW